MADILGSPRPSCETSASLASLSMTLLSAESFSDSGREQWRTWVLAAIIPYQQSLWVESKREYLAIAKAYQLG